MPMSDRQTVITYQLAYRSDISVALCAAHARAYPHSLGAVQHGAHDGACEACAVTAAPYEITTAGDEPIASCKVSVSLADALVSAQAHATSRCAPVLLHWFDPAQAQTHLVDPSGHAGELGMGVRSAPLSTKPKRALKLKRGGK
jgi:hypothetical protein